MSGGRRPLERPCPALVRPCRFPLGAYIPPPGTAVLFAVGGALLTCSESHLDEGRHPMTLSTSTQQFTAEDKDGVLVVTYSSDPLNYLNMASLQELGQLVPIMAQPQYRAVIFQSRPDEVGFLTHFSVEEIYELIKAPETSRYSAEAVRGFKALIDQIVALPKVTIAAMNGDTMGGGHELALACDLRIGEIGDYRYGQPEVRLGIIPGAGGSQRLARLIGLGKALDIILRGRVVTPEEAHALGITSELVADAPARALEIARE